MINLERILKGNAVSTWKIHHWLIAIFGAVGIIFLVFAGVQADRMARIGAGYKAKIACSEIFLAGRSAETVLAMEFEDIAPLMGQIAVTADHKTRTTKAAGPLGFGRIKAVYRDGYGCTLANGGRLQPLPAPAPALASDLWPMATASSAEKLVQVNYQALNAALTKAFDNYEVGHRALLVVVDGKLVAESYADGFDQNTPFLSWSMAKSVTATLIGAAVRRGFIQMDSPAPVDSWVSDPTRSMITWHDLMQMQSGLRFEENYANPRSDVNRMLFEMADVSAIPAKSRVADLPGRHWSYSSGTTNLLSGLLRQELAQHGVDYHRVARDEIFDPIGATSFTMEPDAAGNFIGSSFIYATARDWARLGQLYLQNGRWQGQQVIPEDWSTYVSTPAAASDGRYGAHFWLNRDGENGRPRSLPGLPTDVYFMSGHEGQFVFIIPSKKMVIVRTGMTRGQPSLAATAPLIKEIYDTVSATNF